jgi:hypothetical protein
MFPVCLSDCSAVGKMELRLGKVQIIKAIDDGGVSMYFRRERPSQEQSQRVVLSIEVRSPFPFIHTTSIFLPSHNLIFPRRNVRNTTKKATKKQQTATPRKFLLKCWVKSVVVISIKTWTTNTKKYLPHPLSNIPYPYPLDLRE